MPACEAFGGGGVGGFLGSPCEDFSDLLGTLSEEVLGTFRVCLGRLSGVALGDFLRPRWEAFRGRPPSLSGCIFGGSLEPC